MVQTRYERCVEVGLAYLRTRWWCGQDQAARVRLLEMDEADRTTVLAGAVRRHLRDLGLGENMAERVEAGREAAGLALAELIERAALADIGEGW